MAAALSSASSLAFFQRSSFASTSGTAHNNNPPCNSKFQGSTLSFNPIPGSKPASIHAHLMISAASANGVLSLDEAFQAAPKEDSRFKPVGLESFMEHVKFVNSGSEERGKFIPFVVDDIEVGYIHPSFLQHLVCFPDVFAIVGVDLEHVRFHAHMNALHINSAGTHVRPPPAALVHVNRRRKAGRTESFVTLHRNLKSREQRTAAVNRALRVLSDKGIIPGWRNEFYPVVEAFGTRSLFSLERAVVPYFGVKAYAIHMNGFVQKPNGEKCLWVARRSVTKPTFPGMFDHLVAGGQPEGLSCKENVIKECDEEASIPRAISERAKAVGAVSYECIDGDRFDRFILFCYDLELPCDFRPLNKDGEVDSFTLVPVTKVARILQTTRLYKPDCALVIIDFLFRHGYISSDQSGYLELLRSLRKGDCM